MEWRGKHGHQTAGAGHGRNLDEKRPRHHFRSQPSRNPQGHGARGSFCSSDRSHESIHSQGVLDIPGWRYALTSNGAAVYDLQTDTLLYSDYLDRAVAAEILERIAPLDVFFELYCGGESYIERERLIHYARYNVPDKAIDFFRRKGNQIDSAQEFLEDGRHNLEKIYLPHIRPEIYEELAQILSEYDVAVTSSVDTNLEVNSKTANKGSGLAFLAGYLGFTADEVMAVGDNKNDFELLISLKMLLVILI